MNVESASDLLSTMVTTSLVLVTPVLGAAVVIGVVVSLLQTLTSIQEQTLTFVPKLVGVGFVLVASAHWMLRTVIEFSTMIIGKIPEMAP